MFVTVIMKVLHFDRGVKFNFRRDLVLERPLKYQTLLEKGRVL